MVRKRWRGDAPAVAQVDTVQITAVDGTPADNTFILTINGKTVSVPGDTDEDTTATNLNAAWNASAIPEFAEITSTVVDDTITLTADTAGRPFTCTSSVSGVGAGTIGAVTNGTASSGPNHYDTAANWDPSGVPGDSTTFDAVDFYDSAVSCLYGIDQSGATNALDELSIQASFTGTIGLSKTNANGYQEYREDYLKVDFHSTGDEFIDIGRGSGSGSGRIKIDAETNETDLRVDVHYTGTRAESTVPALLLVTSTSPACAARVNVNRGDVGIAFFPGETASIQELNVGYITTIASDAAVIVGSGTTLAGTGSDLHQRGGTCEVWCDVAQVEVTTGTLTVAGDAEIGTSLLLRGGTCYLDTGGPSASKPVIAEIKVHNGAVLDLRRDLREVTITQLDVYSGASVYDPGRRATLTNGVDTVNCGLQDVTLDLGEDQTWTPSGYPLGK